MHVNILFLTPGHSVNKDYLKSFLSTLALLHKKEISWAFNIEYSSMVSDAREITVSGSKINDIENIKPLLGQITYDKMMWIDSDISWEPEDVLKLYESDKDIITGAYLLGDGSVTAYPKILKRGYTIEDILNMKEVVKIEACGFGFLCVKNGVFESLSRPWFQSTNIDILDEKTEETFNLPVMGEDISWCIRVQNKGYNIWLDPSVRVVHHKAMKLTWEGVMHE